MVYRRATQRFGGEDWEVPKARRFVRSVVEACGGDSDEAALVATELASNAVVHAQSPFTVTVTCSDLGSLIEVDDESPQMPASPAAPLTGISGRGLRLVAAVASAWGVRPRPDEGKTIWAELRISW